MFVKIFLGKGQSTADTRIKYVTRAAGIRARVQASARPQEPGSNRHPIAGTSPVRASFRALSWVGVAKPRIVRYISP
jgi:hypothetical protein